MNMDLSFLFSLRGAVAGVVAIGAVYMILRNAYYGLLFFLFLLMVRPHDLEIFPGMETMPVVKIFAAITILSVMMRMDRWTDIFRFSFQQTLVFLFGFLLVISGSFNPAAFDNFVDKFVPILVIYVLIVILLDKQEHLQKFLLTYVIFTTYLSAYGIYNHEIAGGHTLYDEGLERIYYFGTMSDPNDLALVLVSAIPFLLTFLRKTQSFFLRLSLVFALMLHIMAIGWTYSRGGFLALLTVLLLSSLAGSRKILTVAASAVLLASLFFVSQSFRERILGMEVTDTSQLDLSATYRLELWEAGVQMVKDHPLTGVGMGQFSKRVGNYFPPDTPALRMQTAHNSFVLVAAEAGIPALLLYLLIILTTFRVVRRIRKQSKARGTESAVPVWSRPLTVSMIGILVSGMFLSQGYSWFFFILVAVGDALSRKRLEAYQEVPIEATA